jgi:hypothetical protein
MLFAFSRLGWNTFAMAHPCETRPAGPSYSLPCVVMGSLLVRYNNIVRAVITEQGLYLYMPLPFQFFHRPFLLPWQSIQRVEPYTFLWFRGHILHVRDAAGSARLQVRDSLFQQFADYLPPT